MDKANILFPDTVNQRFDLLREGRDTMAITASELIERLKQSGTGMSKLVAARAWLEKHPDTKAVELIIVMVEGGYWPSGTVAKARDMVGTSNPPVEPNSNESKLDEATQKTKVGGAAKTKPEDYMPSGPVAKPDGWVQSDLVSQARDAKGSFSDSTFTNIRNAAGVKASKKGGEGPQRRFSRSELTKLINAVETGNFQKKKIIADSWRQLLDK